MASEELHIKLSRYEAGEMCQEETVKLFQNLIDTGLAWGLQGSYGRVAEILIQNGLCRAKVMGKKGQS